MKITFIAEYDINKIEHSFEAEGLSPYDILNDHFKAFLLGAGWVFNPCATIDIEEPDDQ